MNDLTSKPILISQEEGLYSFKKWLSSPLSAFFSQRRLDFRREENLKFLCQKLGIERENLILPHQEHRGNVGWVDLENKKFFSDALITKEPGLAIGILTADCFPIFLYDPLTPAVGIVHAGWRSTKEEVLINTILKMQRFFSTRPPHLQVAIGPGIRKCCYEVKEDLRAYFSKHIQGRNGKLFLDLQSANLEQLHSLGIKEENILDSGICSFCENQSFFSFRKEGENVGRTISVIMLKK
ncbi:MAG: polyphenol oxidase family protein [Candidatus Omnitrophica bacterium]|nr:polyphenol oxidase family protein [Candidatus Omnitrophota bacterium]MCM8798272.1 polyphenol oxidase family protein [Candidatus Omnitrophota bacterium]